MRRPSGAIEPWGSQVKPPGGMSSSACVVRADRQLVLAKAVGATRSGPFPTPRRYIPGIGFDDGRAMTGHNPMLRKLPTRGGTDVSTVAPKAKDRIE